MSLLDSLRSHEERPMPETELSLARDLNRLLPAKRLTVAVAEASSGGRIGERLVRYAGATAYFKGAVVTYDYPSRVTVLGIPEPLLQEHGSVSEVAARAMAIAVRDRFAADIGLACTGVAGPGGRSPGDLWVALANGRDTFVEGYRVAARPRVAMQAEFTRIALRILYDYVRSH
jgi:PncC family amidohydrolase